MNGARAELARARATAARPSACRARCRRSAPRRPRASRPRARTPRSARPGSPCSSRKRRCPGRRRCWITCQRIGRPPISTSGFGISALCSCSRVPRPPQRIATSICGRLPGMDQTNAPRGRAPTRASAARSSSSSPPGAARARPRLLDRLAGRGAEGARARSRSSGSTRARVRGDGAERCDRVVVGDVQASPRDLGRFDCLVAADVLEHLVDPWTALDAYVALLEPGCRAVISLPNAATGPPTPRSRAGAGRGGRRASTTPRTCAGSPCATPSSCCEGAGLRVEHVERRPWLLWRGTRLDRHAGPLARLSPFTFQHVLAARRA